ncbi:substrate-binding domain-containing protein, partial [Klebsiella pneumoniae]|nr:substrate-binding domain-containing protein [Klebsiella pneumoniae]
ESLTPPVCAVAQDPEEIGRRAARLILQRLGQTGGAHAACRDEVLPVRMVERAGRPAGSHRPSELALTTVHRAATTAGRLPS